jgi:hypothetical protein
MQQQAASKRRGVCGAATGNRRNEDKVRRTVYISDISDAVTELQLAAFFQDCGQMVDCRVCGDPNSALRFAFIEFLAEESVQQVGACSLQTDDGLPLAKAELAGGRAVLLCRGQVL